MKRVVLNRKNSLFVGNPRGGRTAAILASLASTCRRHEVDPQLYLTQLLVNLPPLLSSVPHSRRQEVEASPRHPHRRPAKQSGSTYRRRICLVNVIPHPHTNLCLTHRSHTAGSPPRGGSAAPTPNSGTGSAPPPDGKALGSLLRLEDLHRSELCNGYDGSIARQTRQDHVSQVSNRSVAS